VIQYEIFIILVGVFQIFSRPEKYFCLSSRDVFHIFPDQTSVFVSPVGMLLIFFPTRQVFSSLQSGCYSYFPRPDKCFRLSSRDVTHILPDQTSVFVSPVGMLLIFSPTRQVFSSLRSGCYLYFSRLDKSFISPTSIFLILQTEKG